MPDRWFFYQLGGWVMAVNAISHHDAAAHIKIHALGAKFLGERTPGPGDEMVTGMVTEKRQQQIRDNLEREYEAWESAGRPGAWWDNE